MWWAGKRGGRGGRRRGRAVAVVAASAVLAAGLAPWALKIGAVLGGRTQPQAAPAGATSTARWRHDAGPPAPDGPAPTPASPSSRSAAPPSPGPEPTPKPVPAPKPGKGESKAPPTPSAPPERKPESWPEDLDVGARSWPVGAPPPVLRGWVPPASPYGPGHRGVDLGAEPGAAVRAAAAGRVLFAGKVAGRGVVTVEVAASGSPPLRTTYEPVLPTVRKGEVVAAGAQIGVLDGAGPFHCATPCLHWGLLRADLYLDPLSLLPPGWQGHGPSRLLPLAQSAAPKPSVDSRASVTAATGDGAGKRPADVSRTRHAKPSRRRRRRSARALRQPRTRSGARRRPRLPEGASPPGAAADDRGR